MASINKKESNFIYIILTIFIMVIFVFIAEALIVSKILKKDPVNYDSSFSSKTNDKFYDVTKEDTIPINLNEKVELNTICNNVCSLKSENYYFMFKKDNNKYLLYITDGSRLLKTVDLGVSIDDVYLRYYDKDILIYNKIKTDSFIYDYAVFISPNDSIDEFTSLEADEMEISSEGIIYYYDSCNKGKNPNAYKIKAIRKPFDKQAKELSREEKNYSWCSN